MRDNLKQTHFGYQLVTEHEKDQQVRAVFSSVANRYDLMNDLMSFGIHRIWKRLTVEMAHIRPGQHILDLAGGSGDLTALMTKKIGNNGHIILADINSAMLEVGRDRLLDRGLSNTVSFIQANAESLPFANNSFHAIIIAFGLRNITDKAVALQEMYRVCKPGGKLCILEFSKPYSTVLQTMYDWYSLHCVPKLGGIIANDTDSYQYLVESIRVHPAQEPLMRMMEQQGFESCCYRNFTGGIVAVHSGYKY